jgi:hypothetical protein
MTDISPLASLAPPDILRKIEADGDAKSVVTRAQGEADANRIRQSSISPQLLELRRLENQRAYIDKWNGQLPSVEAGQGTGLLLQLPKGQ